MVGPGLHGSPLDAVRWAAVAPYPRMIELHLTVILGLFLLGGPDGRTANDLGAVAVLMGVKTVLDLAFHLVEHRVIASRVVRIVGSLG